MVNRLAVGLILVLLLGGQAAAQDYRPGIGFAAGYSNISLDGGDGTFDGSDGGYLDIVFRLEPDMGQGLAFEVGANFAWTEEDLPDRLDVFDGFDSDIEANLGVTTLPEGRVTWKQPLGRHFYIEPGAGIGLLILSYYRFDDDYYHYYYHDHDYDDEYGIGIAIRPFVRAAYQFERWSLGLESAYMVGWAEVDDVGDEVEQLNVGIFAQLIF